MSAPIVRSASPITLLGAGSVPSGLLKRALKLAPNLVCADGGAAVALEARLRPTAVIGDFDSLTPEIQAALPQEVLHPILEQDSTDFDKCLRHIAAPLVLGVGFNGNRVDHQLATYNVLLRRPERRCILLTSDQIVLLAPPHLQLDLSPGDLVSLFPMAPVSGRSTGLRWPIEGIGFAPDGRSGTSNEALGTVDLQFDAPKMLLILPLFTLERVMAALSSAPEWPAPAR